MIPKALYGESNKAETPIKASRFPSARREVPVVLREESLLRSVEGRREGVEIIKVEEPLVKHTQIQSLAQRAYYATTVVRTAAVKRLIAQKMQPLCRWGGVFDFSWMDGWSGRGSPGIPGEVVVTWGASKFGVVLAIEYLGNRTCDGLAKATRDDDMNHMDTYHFNI